MRVAAVLALLAVASASFAGTYLRPMDVPEDLTCDMCQVVVGAIGQIAENQTSLAALLKGLESGCAAVFPNDTLAQDGCDLLAGLLVKELPTINKDMIDLAWEPIAFCATFIPVCTMPCCATNTVPEQLHLSFTGNGGSEMTITWTTLLATSTSTVQWGPSNSTGALMDPETLPFSATGSNRTYTWSGWIGQIHEAMMTGLVPDTEYVYRVGDASGGWSDLTTFRTLAPNAGSVDRPLRIVQLGDTGYGPASDTTIATISAMVAAGQVDFVAHVGDIGYADGYCIHWDAFLNKVQPIASHIPYMVNPGNHELWQNFTAYKTRFSMPNREYDNMRHTYNAGSVHFLNMNTETWIDTADLSPEQVQWMAEDLKEANANRAAQPWIIATGHRPFYCSNGNTMQCKVFPVVLRALGEQVLFENQVDLVINAHEHDMEASFPMYQGNATQLNYNHPKAPVYVVNGAGGNREGNEMPNGAPWSAWRSSAIGFGYIVVAGPNSLTYNFVAANGTTLHSFQITK